VNNGDGTRSCAKCGKAEGEWGDLCGTGLFGTGRKLVKWIDQTTVGSRAAGELEKMYAVHDLLPEDQTNQID
jgi:hypothetical protein